MITFFPIFDRLSSGVAEYGPLRRDAQACERFGSGILFEVGTRAFFQSTRCSEPRTLDSFTAQISDRRSPKVGLTRCYSAYLPIGERSPANEARYFPTLVPIKQENLIVLMALNRETLGQPGSPDNSESEFQIANSG
jgi:hypothetical protein